MAAPSVTTNPLEPLTGDEIVAAVAAVREARDLGERVRFVSVELREPSKDAIAAGLPPREAFLVVLTNDDGMTHEAAVSLDEGRLIDWRDVPGVHPAIHIDEFDDAGNAIVADPRFREALAKRGIEDPDMVMVDPWSIGCFEDGERRLARGLAWLRADLEGDNGYSRPIGGLVGVVDLNTMEVVRIDDHGVLPVPSGEGGDYRPGAISPPRDRRPPLRDQPARRAELHPRRPSARAGRAGRSTSASRRARGSCCIGSRTPAGPCATGRRSPSS